MRVGEQRTSRSERPIDQKAVSALRQNACRMDRMSDPEAPNGHREARSAPVAYGTPGSGAGDGPGPSRRENGGAGRPDSFWRSAPAAVSPSPHGRSPRLRISLPRPSGRFEQPCAPVRPPHPHQRAARRKRASATALRARTWATVRRSGPSEVNGSSLPGNGRSARTSPPASQVARRQPPAARD